MKKFLSLVLTLIILAMPLALTSCGSGEDTTVNIGYFNNITHPQALYMKSQKLLEESLGDTMEVDWTAFNAGPAEVEALFSGSIDIGYIGPVPAITANSKSNGDVMILTSATKGGAVLIARKDSNINSVADLKGKKVAIPQLGNTQHLCLLDLLEQNGLDPDKDLTVCAVSNADVSNTISRGDIDAALVPEPWGATILAENDDTELVLNYDEIYMNGEYDVAVVVVRKDFYEEYPDVVEAFLEQHNFVTDKINENQEEALQIINQELDDATGKSLSESAIKEAFTRIGVSTDLNVESISGFAKISKEQEFIAEIPDDSQLYIK